MANTNIITIITFSIWLMVVFSFLIFDFAVYIKIIFISIKTRSKEPLFRIISNPYPISFSWDFLYNFFLLTVIAFGFVAVGIMMYSVLSMAARTMMYSTLYEILRYLPFLLFIPFILGIFTKIEWIDKITAPRVNLFGKSIALAVPWKLQGYVIRWHVKNEITIFYNILKIMSVWLLIVGMVFFILLEMIFGNLTIKSFLPI